MSDYEKERRYIEVGFDELSSLQYVTNDYIEADGSPGNDNGDYHHIRFIRDGKIFYAVFRSISEWDDHEGTFKAVEQHLLVRYVDAPQWNSYNRRLVEWWDVRYDDNGEVIKETWSGNGRPGIV